MQRSQDMKLLKKQMRRLSAIIMPRIAPKPMVVSFPKCGRTWIANVLLNYIYYYGNPSSPPLDFVIRPQFKDIVKGTPFEPIVFSHDVFSLKIPIDEWPRKSAVRHRRRQTAFIVRDPRDVLVSLYHHVLGRRHKNDLAEDTSLRCFLEDYELSLDALIMFLNIWAPAVVSARADICAFRYEDFLGLWTQNADVWIEFANFITGCKINEQALRRAVEDNEIDTLKQRLKKQNVEDANLMGAGGRIRKGRSGSYLEELLEEDKEMIEQRLLFELNSEAKELAWWPYVER